MKRNSTVEGNIFFTLSLSQLIAVNFLLAHRIVFAGMLIFRLLLVF